MVPSRRFTVLRQSDGHFLLEDAHTGEQARVDTLDEAGAQIERWLHTADPPLPPALEATPIARRPEA